jgi:GNAT superfamily N-acetyltransferase
VKLDIVAGKDGYRDFAEFGARVYQGNPHYRGTQDSVEKLLLLGPTAFHDHARVLGFLVVDGGEVVARFALIHDRRLPDFVQVAFFEARPGLTGLWDLIAGEAGRRFPEASRVVAGVNGHINYGAAFLMNRFDQPPVFGLPYSQDYYPAYFASLQAHTLVSFRFTMPEIHRWVESYGPLSRMEGITLRFLDKKQLRRDMEHYTRLNNASFGGHPFWSDRSAAEDFELFHPFRHLFDEENLVFAEHDGRPVAFFLWYPDFNGLIDGPRDLGLRDWLRFKMGRRPDAFRFTQIGIHPDYRRRPLTLAMIRKAIPTVARAGYNHCEGGFIFEDNRASMALVKRILRRSFGGEVEPYRRYAVFEGALK